MPVKIKPTSQIKIRLGIEPNGRVQRFAVHTCAIHMDKYLPFDTGTLARTVEERQNAVVYNQPYAEIVYKGVRNEKELNYQTDKHPLAGPYWEKRMMSAEGKDVIKEIQNFTRR